jgi:type I restriction enzyme, S subunit
MRSDSIVEQASGGTRSVGVPDLGIKRIREFRIPLPSLTVQNRTVAELGALQAKVCELKRLQAETRKELDALLPSILDRAFEGKL